MSKPEQTCHNCTHMDIPDGEELCYSYPGSVKPVNKDFVKDFCEGDCPEFILITNDVKVSYSAATVDSGVRCPICDADNCEPGIVHTNIDKEGNNRVWFKCIYCKQMVSVYGRKVIVFDTPTRAPHLNTHEGA